MAEFDGNSAMQGAAAGSSFGPWGAAAGFVAGGVLGGKNAKSAEKRRRQAEERRIQLVRNIASAPNYADTANQLRPHYENLARQTGAYSAPVSAAATQVGRNRMSGTGHGAAMMSAAAGAGPAQVASATHQGAMGLVGMQAQGAAGVPMSFPQTQPLFGSATPGQLGVMSTQLRGNRGTGNPAIDPLGPPPGASHAPPPPWADAGWRPPPSSWGDVPAPFAGLR